MSNEFNKVVMLARRNALYEARKIASIVTQFPNGHCLSCVDPGDYCTCGYKTAEKIEAEIMALVNKEEARIKKFGNC